jgi:hypothetical protein
MLRQIVRLRSAANLLPDAGTRQGEYKNNGDSQTGDNH